jgi:ABC-type antimicrobial peptide transport system permease subunit
MIIDAPEDPPVEGIERTLADADLLKQLCGVLAFVGGLMATLGAVIGIMMAVKSTPIDCPDGYVSSGDDPQCYAHLHAGEGTAIALISGVLLVLVVLAALIASVLPALRAASRTSQPSTTSTS